MDEWTFRVFVDTKGKSDPLEWRNGLEPKVRARMDQIIGHMEITKDWTQTPYFRPLRGYSGICEIRFTVRRQQFRPLGCYGPGKNEFTLLIGAMEVNNKFSPLSAPSIALERRKLILKDRRYTDDYY